MRAPARLTLERFVPFRLNRLASEISRALARVYGERFGIDVPQWRVIATLGDRGQARAQDVVLSTRMHKSVVSRAVGRLAALGWVARSPGGRDRREAPLALTPEGRRVYEALVPVVLDYEGELLAALEPEERLAFEAILAKLERQLDLPCRAAPAAPPAPAAPLPEPRARKTG
jgi:DNA-binding MarR family transcriptional regulator